MSKTMQIVSYSLLLTLLTAAVATADPTSDVYGAGVTLEHSTPIRDIVEDPEAWAGKQVRVEGLVVGVCTNKGCWMELESPDEHRLRIQVEDDVIVFPPEAKGNQAVAEGTVEMRDLDREQYTAWLRHVAEDQGETFDEASVGEGPYRLVQIRGTGAEIAGH